MPRWRSRRAPCDPVCGMSVDARTAVHRLERGAVYHFCSEECRNFCDARLSALARLAERRALGGELDLRAARRLKMTLPAGSRTAADGAAVVTTVQRAGIERLKSGRL